jgi:nicotinamidase-related amidase
MDIAMPGPEIGKSALIVVDMQNDFVHPNGGFARCARENPERNWDIPFIMGTIPQVKRLIDAFRRSGRPVVHVITTHKPDYADAAWPHWNSGLTGGNRTFLFEGSWGARIADELFEHLDAPVKRVAAKGMEVQGTALDDLRSMGVTTCVIAGVTTTVCVSTTLRGGVGNNYSMILVEDAVAETRRELHEAEVKILGLAFADVKTTDGVIAMFADLAPVSNRR